MVLVSMLGTKLTYAQIGDCSLTVFREMPQLGLYSDVFTTTPRYQGTTPDGRMIPTQIAIYDPSLFAKKDMAVAAATDIHTAKVDVKLNDVIVISSDGVGDNLSVYQMKEIVNSTMAAERDPWLLAKRIVESAITMNLKPDDVSCAVGFVVKK